jgi:hypothetical protein
MEFDDYGEEDYDQNYFYVEDSYDAAVSTFLAPDRAFPELGKEGVSFSKRYRPDRIPYKAKCHHGISWDPPMLRHATVSQLLVHHMPAHLSSYSKAP